jgi:hypothetical protein
MHSGRDQNFFAYSESPNAFGNCAHMVINKYTRCTWAGGTFFPVVLLCQFLVLVGNRFWFYILMYLEYNTVVVLC